MPRLYTAYRFVVEVEHIQVATFSECSALVIETETMPYQEGGVNDFTHHLPVRTKYSNITLKRGIDENRELYRWYMMTQRSLEQKQAIRKNISILCYTTTRTEAPMRWDLLDAFPVKWTGPEFRVDNHTVAVESVEFTYSRISPSTTGGRPQAK